MRVLDGAVMVYDSVGGVQPQSETVWRQANKYHVPRGVRQQNGPSGCRFLPRRTDDAGTPEGESGAYCDPVGAEEHFTGVVDLIKMRTIVWDDATQGMVFNYAPVPDELLSTAQEWREKWSLRQQKPATR